MYRVHQVHGDAIIRLEETDSHMPHPCLLAVPQDISSRSVPLSAFSFKVVYCILREFKDLLLTKARLPPEHLAFVPTCLPLRVPTKRSQKSSTTGVPTKGSSNWSGFHVRIISVRVCVVSGYPFFTRFEERPKGKSTCLGSIPLSETASRGFSIEVWTWLPGCTQCTVGRWAYDFESLAELDLISFGKIILCFGRALWRLFVTSSQPVSLANFSGVIVLLPMRLTARPIWVRDFISA